MSASASHAFASAPSPLARACSVVPSIFRRWVNTCRTIASKRAWSAIGDPVGAEHDADDSGVDLRGRPEGARREHEDATHIGLQGHRDRQRTVVAGAGDGDQAVRHFLLEHQDGVGDAALPGVPQQATEHRCRHVVRQVGGDPVRAVALEPGLGGHVEEVAFVHVDAGQVRVPATRPRGRDRSPRRGRLRRRARSARSAGRGPGRFRGTPRPAAARWPRRPCRPRPFEEVLAESLACLACPPQPWRRRNH